jgi:flagellar protein FlaG
MDIDTSIRNTIDTIRHKPVAKPAQVEIHSQQEENGGTEATGNKMQNMVDTLNKAAVNVDKRVSFAYSEETKRIIMRVMDPKTNELVRQIPSREMIQLLERINEITGLLLDETG